MNKITTVGLVGTLCLLSGAGVFQVTSALIAAPSKAQQAVPRLEIHVRWDDVIFITSRDTRPVVIKSVIVNHKCNIGTSLDAFRRSPVTLEYAKSIATVANGTPCQDDPLLRIEVVTDRGSVTLER